MRYIFLSRVVRVEERIDEKWLEGMGPNAKFAPVSRGWFVLLDGSHEAIHVGYEKPSFNPGDNVRVTIERNHG